MTGKLQSIPARVYMLVLIALAIMPVIISYSGQSFYLDLLTRVLILAIAVVSLNLIIGYGGMISLGHAAYIGIGAYSVGILSYYEIYNGYIHLLLAILCSGIFALITGAICLRARGLYFLMITLAFAQMMYFTMISIDEYGADDGLIIYQRSEFGNLFDIENATFLYYTVLVVLLLCLYLTYRLVHSRFGKVLIGAKHNEERMQALGFDTYTYRLTCYVIAGVMAGIAGFLLANFTNFISPDTMDWTHSGELIFMMVIGGTGSLFGPVIGSMAFLILEESLSSITLHWQLIFGLLLIALVLFGKGGLHGLLVSLENGRVSASDDKPGNTSR